MVFHDFMCAIDECPKVEMNVLVSTSDEATWPQCCGQTMEISYQKSDIGISNFVAFETRNIHPDGKPLKVRNKGDLLRYAREYGVRHCDDPDLVAEGTEIRRRGPRAPLVFMDMGGKR